uniref:Uncharacterized protein n=1 Tax=Glossina pallidipes TaxID=7398 RepID=A0A1A9ZRG4_GLOPL
MKPCDQSAHSRLFLVSSDDLALLGGNILHYGSLMVLYKMAGLKMSLTNRSYLKRSNVRHKNIRNGLPPPNSLGAGSLTTIGSNALLLRDDFGKVISSSAAVVANSTVVVTTSASASVDMGSNTSGKCWLFYQSIATLAVAGVEQLHVLFVVSGKDKESESSNEEAKSSLLNCTNGCIMKDCCVI